MQEHVRAGLVLRRRVQLAAWASLLGIVTCFIALIAFERRLDIDAAQIKAALLVFVAAYFGAVLFLRARKCPACGERFSGALGRGVGAYTELTTLRCQHCGVMLK